MFVITQDDSSLKVKILPSLLRSTKVRGVVFGFRLCVVTHFRILLILVLCQGSRYAIILLVLKYRCYEKKRFVESWFTYPFFNGVSIKDMTFVTLTPPVSRKVGRTQGTVRRTETELGVLRSVYGLSSL